MLGAAVPVLCSFSRTAGRSLIRMVWAGVSAGAAGIAGAECSAGGAGGCCPFTWAARSFGKGPARWRELTLVWRGGGLSPSGAGAGASTVPGPLHLIDGLDLDALAFRLVLVKLLDVFILQELGRLLRGNGGLGPGGDFPGALFCFRPFGLFLG